MRAYLRTTLVALASLVLATGAAQAQSNPLYKSNASPSARTMAKGTPGKNIEGMMVGWEFAGNGTIKLCWPAINCVILGDAQIYNTEYTDKCSNQGGRMAPALADLRKSGNLKQKMFAQFDDCYSGTHDLHWQGTVTLVNNVTGVTYRIYSSEIRGLRTDPID